MAGAEPAHGTANESAWTNIASSSRFRLPGLDAMRTASVLIVIASHTYRAIKVPGDAGVTVFFFISGLLITSLLLREQQANGTIGIRSFYIRRYFRLMPELFCYIVANVISIGIIGREHLSFLDVSSSLFYFYNYVKALRGDIVYAFGTFEHLWSLSVEEHFYLIFPLLCSLTIKNTRRFLVILTGLLIGSIAWRYVHVALLGTGHGFYYLSDTRFDSIGYGCLVAVLFNSMARGRAPLRSWHVTVLLILALAMFAASFAIHGTLGECLKFSLQGMAIVAAVCALYLAPADNWMLRTLEKSIFERLGCYTYGMYLWHPMLIAIARRGLGWNLAFGAHAILSQTIEFFGFTLASIGISILSHHFVLKRFDALRRRYGAHIRG